MQNCKNLKSSAYFLRTIKLGNNINREKTKQSKTKIVPDKTAPKCKIFPVKISNLTQKKVSGEIVPTKK